MPDAATHEVLAPESRWLTCFDQIDDNGAEMEMSLIATTRLQRDGLTATNPVKQDSKQIVFWNRKMNTYPYERSVNSYRYLLGC